MSLLAVVRFTTSALFSACKLCIPMIKICVNVVWIVRIGKKCYHYCSTVDPTPAHCIANENMTRHKNNQTLK